MLVALSDVGERRIAERGMTAEPFRCPMCEGRVILKRGRKVAAHFAHLPGAFCPYAEAESWRHLLAKQVLMEEFHERGWHARLEVAHPDVGRRVDVGVRVPDGKGGVRYVAIEIQDSAIGVETMKKRVVLDKRKNYAATAWLFTSTGRPVFWWPREHESRCVFPRGCCEWSTGTAMGCRSSTRSSAPYTSP